MNRRIAGITEDFRAEVKNLTDKLSVIRAAAEWLYQVQSRPTEELSALQDIISAVQVAITQTDAFRKISEAMISVESAEEIFRQLRGDSGPRD